MSDELNQPNDAGATPDSANAGERPIEVKRYQHDVATRLVPMQIDHLGRQFWESYMTPVSYQVRALVEIPPQFAGDCYLLKSAEFETTFALRG
jgi:hypothetical protein